MSLRHLNLDLTKPEESLISLPRALPAHHPSAPPLAPPMHSTCKSSSQKPGFDPRCPCVQAYLQILGFLTLSSLKALPFSPFLPSFIISWLNFNNSLYYGSFYFKFLFAIYVAPLLLFHHPRGCPLPIGEWLFQTPPLCLGRQSSTPSATGLLLSGLQK